LAIGEERNSALTRDSWVKWGVVNNLKIDEAEADAMSDIAAMVSANLVGDDRILKAESESERNKIFNDEMVRLSKLAGISQQFDRSRKRVSRAMDEVGLGRNRGRMPGRMR
jgi:hypothetical protein